MCSDFSSGQCTDPHKSINVSAGIFECIGQGLNVCRYPFIAFPIGMESSYKKGK